MSIEKILTELTTAIIANTASINAQFEDAVDVSSKGMGAAVSKKQLSSEAPPPPADSATTDSPTPTEKAPPPPEKVITSEDLNNILKNEFVRIGSVREPIDEIMKEHFDVDSLHNLKSENYAELVEAVSKIPSV